MRGRRRRDGHDAAAAGPDPRRLRRARGLQRDPQRDPSRRRPARSTTRTSPPAADCVETNTFGANHANLGEYDIAARIYELARAAARSSPVRQQTPGRHPSGPRWVLGSVGPGTKLPTLGHVDFATLRDAYAEQVRGMLDGGVDAVLVETAQDLLQAKAAVIGAKRAIAAARAAEDAPVIVNVTVETTGTMLLGTEIGAALTALEPARHRPDRAQLRHRAGRDERAPALPRPRTPRVGIACMPNAGLPQLTSDGAYYPLTPEQLADAHDTFTREFGLCLVGGCCGTTPEHIRQVVERVGGRRAGTASGAPRGGSRVALPARAVPPGHVVPVDRRAHERQRQPGVPRRDARRAAGTTASRSRGRQIRDGAHLLDLCIDYVGRDGVADMRSGRTGLRHLLDPAGGARLHRARASSRPGSRRWPGGASSTRSTTRTATGPARGSPASCRSSGSTAPAVVALTIDEEGQARTADVEGRGRRAG